MKAEELFVNAIEHWKDNNGIGTALIPSPLEDKTMILGVLQRMYAKTPNLVSMIIVNNFTERKEIIDFLTKQDDEENNEEFKKLISSKLIKIFTTNFIEREDFNMKVNVTILYHCEELGNYVYRFLSKTKFRLVVLNCLKLSNEDITKLYAVCPLLSDFKQNEIDALRTSTPVEEMRIGVDINPDSEDYKLLQYYDEYITTTINIFGSFDNIKYARCGDERANISATQFCYNLALENGWSENLDKTVELNVQIDDLYNPSNLRDRASQTYEIIRNRGKLLCNYKAKLDEILRIVEEHKDKHILIINKFAEFAATVTEYINNSCQDEVCGNYHDSVEPIPAYDVYGNALFIKSGPHRGERKMYAAKAQKTYNEERFNHGIINVLSTNNTPDKSLNIPVDVVIITSPACEDIESYIYRLSNLRYESGTIKLYTLYIRNSVEEKRIESKPISETHILIGNEQKSEKIEENFDFIIAD